MPRLFTVKPPLTIRGRKFKGIRGWAGKPTHPPLTDIPVACYFIFPIFDLISLIAEDGSDTSRDVACAFCDFEGRGTLEECRERWAGHECGRPPEKPKGRAPWPKPAMLRSA